MRTADVIVDIGPGAGAEGGEILTVGKLDDVLANPISETGAYLSGRKFIPIPKARREPRGWLDVRKATANNINGVDVRFPIGVFAAVTGVSGSGKSTLVNQVLVRALNQHLHDQPAGGTYGTVKGAAQLDKLVVIDQSPIGRTPRSNPATYTGAFDHIRELFSLVPEAKMRGYTPGRFSFNVKGGRCEACEGDGIIKIEMHFLPDVYVPCEVCKGKRYNAQTLEVKYKGKTIADVLEMRVDEATELFATIPRIHNKLKTICEVGLGYIKMGQPATTLSGGEAQRVKLATELSRRSTGRTFYVLDEPTTGLHFADIHKLLEVLAEARGDRQHRARDRAQPRRHQDRGLPDRSGAGRRRPRRHRRRHRHARGTGDERRVVYRRLPGAGARRPASGRPSPSGRRCARAHGARKHARSERSCEG